MNKDQVENINVESQTILITPEKLKQELPIEGPALETISESRQVIRDILDRKDHRLCR